MDQKNHQDSEKKSSIRVIDVLPRRYYHKNIKLEDVESIKGMIEDAVALIKDLEDEYESLTDVKGFEQKLHSLYQKHNFGIEYESR